MVITVKKCTKFTPPQRPVLKITNKNKQIIEGSLEVKLPTIWRDQKKQRREEYKTRVAERKGKSHNISLYLFKLEVTIRLSKRSLFRHPKKVTSRIARILRFHYIQARSLIQVAATCNIDHTESRKGCEPWCQ